MALKLFRDKRFMGSCYSRLPCVSFACAFLAGQNSMS